MSARKTTASSRVSMTTRTQRKETTVTEVKKEVKTVRKEEKVVVAAEAMAVEVNGAETVAVANGEANGTVNGATANGVAVNGAECVVEPMELPPFEIITGDRMDPFHFKYQFKNVEYCSGRNKTFLCYLMDEGATARGLLRGYIEDEHLGAHAEQAFFFQILPEYDPNLKYTITWYVTSSPCPTCAAKLVEILGQRKNVKLTIFSSRLLDWEEPDVQAGLRALHAAGCKLRMMKPLDFTYTWDTFVDGDEMVFTPWEDCQENYEWYAEKLADILQWP